MLECAHKKYTDFFQRHYRHTAMPKPLTPAQLTKAARLAAAELKRRKAAATKPAAKPGLKKASALAKAKGKSDCGCGGH